MVLKKIRDAFSANDEKYEILYYKYSQMKLENIKLKQKHEKDMKIFKKNVMSKMSNHLIELFQKVESAKSDSYKVKATDKDIQRLLLSINQVEKDMKKVMTDFSIEEISANERFYDPELHEVASYQDANGMKKGIILKTAKKGFKYRGETIIKPKVVVTK